MANAVKFTPSGWVTVQVSYADGKLICVVADSGAGIPVEKRTQIFEPFTQLDSTDTRRFGGVGLGLAVVADLCRQLGGSIQVDTAEGGGARFTLQLPYAAVPGEGGWLESRATGVAVLLAADSPAIRIFTTYLGHAGLAVIRFRDAGQWRCWTPPAEGHIFCFVDGAVFGPTPPPWCNPKTITVLLGGMNYLRSLSESQKSQFDDVLPLPVPARSLREILHPVSVRSSPLPLPSRLHVLVVDDNAVNRRVLTALLEKLGCHVDTARNGREAVDAFVRDRYAAILMDCQMPVMNGYEAAAEIRRHPAGKDLAICGISASTDAETRDRCHASGMNEYLPKPVTLENLHDLLTRIAAQRVIAENLRRDV
jgi:CheY-like chemotaxis protein